MHVGTGGSDLWVKFRGFTGHRFSRASDADGLLVTATKKTGESFTLGSTTLTIRIFGDGGAKRVVKSDALILGKQRITVVDGRLHLGEWSRE